MKTLYILRHAKSSWAEKDISDFERPLNNAGSPPHLSWASLWPPGISCPA